MKKFAVFAMVAILLCVALGCSETPDPRDIVLDINNKPYQGEGGTTDGSGGAKISGSCTIAPLGVVGSYASVTAWADRDIDFFGSMSTTTGSSGSWSLSVDPDATYSVVITKYINGVKYKGSATCSPGGSTHVMMY